MALIFLIASFLTTYTYSAYSNILTETNSILLTLIIILGIVLIIMFIYFLMRLTINALDLYRIKKGKEWSVGAGSKVAGYNTRRAY